MLQGIARVIPLPFCYYQCACGAGASAGVVLASRKAGAIPNGFEYLGFANFMSHLQEWGHRWVHECGCFRPLCYPDAGASSLRHSSCLPSWRRAHANEVEGACWCEQGARFLARAGCQRNLEVLKIAYSYDLLGRRKAAKELEQGREDLRSIHSALDWDLLRAAKARVEVGVSHSRH